MPASARPASACAGALRLLMASKKPSAVAGDGLPVHDELARGEHRRDGVGFRQAAAPVKLALVLLHVVDQLALQVFAPEQRLGHRLRHVCLMRSRFWRSLPVSVLRPMKSSSVRRSCCACLP
jgi:hypothetical protein